MPDKNWQKKNPERVNAYHRKYRSEHPEYREKQRDYHLAGYYRERYLGNPLRFISAVRKRKYGMTQEEFEARIETQKNACAICGKQMAVPHVDHNHRTGQNRELLCKNCNTALGLFYEDVNILNGAIRYIQKHNQGDV